MVAQLMTMNGLPALPRPAQQAVAFATTLTHIYLSVVEANLMSAASSVLVEVSLA